MGRNSPSISKPTRTHEATVTGHYSEPEYLLNLKTVAERGASIHQCMI